MRRRLLRAALGCAAALVPAAPAAAAGPAVDAAVKTHQAAPATTLVSGTLTTTAPNDLLVAFLTSDGPGSAGSQSFRSVTGGGLTWRLRQRTNSRPGTAEIWVAVAPAPLTNLTVTATRSSGSYVGSIAVVAFSGASTADGSVGGAAAASGAPTVTVTPSRSGSWVWGVGNDYSRAAARTAGSGQTLFDQYLASVGDTYWVQSQAAPGTVAGLPVSLTDTAPTNDQFDFAAIEVAPAGLAPPDTTPPSAPTGLTAAASAPDAVDLAWRASSDDTGVTGYRVLRDGALVATTAALAYRDSGRSPSTTYTYAVQAVDAAGNVGAASNPATVTTPAPADTTPPSVTVTQPAAGATVSGTAALAASASDDVGVAGVRFQVDGADVGAEDSAPPYDASWDTTAVPDGPHTVTAVARDAAGHTQVSAPVSVTVANAPADGGAPRPISADAMVSTHQSASASSISSPRLTTTAANDVLVAFLASDGPAGSKTMSFSGVSGGGLAWRLRQRTNTQSGTAEVWQAVAAAPVTDLVVTATRSGGGYTGAITVAAFRNAAAVDGAVAGADAATGAPAATLTTTRPGSWVWAVGEDYDTATARTVGAGQTKVDEYLSPSSDTYWVQRQAAPTAAAGTRVTIDDTAPAKDRWNLSAIELVAASGPADTTPPTVQLTAPGAGEELSGQVTVSAGAADEGGLAGVQFLLDGRPLGDPDTDAPYAVTWNTLTAQNGDHVLAARASDDAGNTATSAAVPVTTRNDASGTAPALDPATPAAGPVLNNVTATTSPQFSPPAGSVVYAVFSMDSPASASITTITSVASSGTPLAWHLLGRENHNNGSSVGGFVEVWWAYNPAAQAAISATATFSQPTKNVPAPVGDFQILVLDGAAADQSAAAWTPTWLLSSGNAASATVTTTAPNSRVFAVFDNWDNSTRPVPGPDQSIISIVLNDTDRDGYWMQSKDTPVATPGAVTMNATIVGNPNAWHAIAWEVLAAR